MFNQPARKTRRRNGLSTSNRYLVKGFPRPAGRLRPQVHGQTLKYNMKLREGRGFSLEELKCLSFNNSASWILPGSLAHTIVLLVKIETRTGLVKAGDSTPEELATATQVQGPVLPILREKPTTELVKVTEEMKSFNALLRFVSMRTNQRHQGASLRGCRGEKWKKRNRSRVLVARARSIPGINRKNVSKEESRRHRLKKKKAVTKPPNRHLIRKRKKKEVQKQASKYNKKETGGKQETAIDEKAENTAKECTKWKDKKKDKEQEALLISEDEEPTLLGRPLALSFNYKSSDLYITDAFFGLLVVGFNGGLATQLPGVYKYLSGLNVESYTRNVYMADASLTYDISSMSGAGGPSVSSDRKYVLVPEYVKNRIQRHWLQGPKHDTNEVFVTDCGSPKSIKRAISDGEFWVAIENQGQPQGLRVNGSAIVLETVPLTQFMNMSPAVVQEGGNALYVGFERH
ncbi:six-bladed beta-propeller, TolB-like protein [Tanacetum coccineum]